MLLTLRLTLLESSRRWTWTTTARSLWTSSSPTAPRRRASGNRWRYFSVSFQFRFFFWNWDSRTIFFVIFLLLCTVWWHLKLDRVSKDIFSTLKLSSGVSFINRFVQSATNGLVNSILALNVLFSFTNKIMPNYTSGNN